MVRVGLRGIRILEMLFNESESILLSLSLLLEVTGQKDVTAVQLMTGNITFLSTAVANHWQCPLASSSWYLFFLGCQIVCTRLRGMPKSAHPQEPTGGFPKSWAMCCQQFFPNKVFLSSLSLHNLLLLLLNWEASYAAHCSPLAIVINRTEIQPEPDSKSSKWFPICFLVNQLVPLLFAIAG